MIRACIFDLDGTLFDSMRVWTDVDDIFFSRRNIAVPEDYAKCVAGLSYIGTAKYTKARFNLDESAEDIAREWTETAIDEYKNKVLLKSGAIELLNRLKAKGIRLAVATALREDLYKPCMVRNGIYDMFEFVLSCEDIGDSKRDGRLFLMAADKLGVKNTECAVFEDVCDGILGAKAAGMRAYCVIDEHSTHNIEKILSVANGASARISDLWIDFLSEG